jgi:hypothetical protein
MQSMCASWHTLFSCSVRNCLQQLSPNVWAFELPRLDRKPRCDPNKSNDASMAPSAGGAAKALNNCKGLSCMYIKARQPAAR